MFKSIALAALLLSTVACSPSSANVDRLEARTVAPTHWAEVSVDTPKAAPERVKRLPQSNFAEIEDKSNCADPGDYEHGMGAPGINGFEIVKTMHADDGSIIRFWHYTRKEGSYPDFRDVVSANEICTLQ